MQPTIICTVTHFLLLWLHTLDLNETMNEVKVLTFIDWGFPLVTRSGWQLKLKVSTICWRSLPKINHLIDQCSSFNDQLMVEINYQANICLSQFFNTSRLCHNENKVGKSYATVCASISHSVSTEKQKIDTRLIISVSFFKPMILNWISLGFGLSESKQFLQSIFFRHHGEVKALILLSSFGIY